MVALPQLRVVARSLRLTDVMAANDHVELLFRFIIQAVRNQSSLYGLILVIHELKHLFTIVNVDSLPCRSWIWTTLRRFTGGTGPSLLTSFLLWIIDWLESLLNDDLLGMLLEATY